tara:strand:- start:284 stop:925 length:642 start_codon:yes stop_codon:yes gene_type:complete
MMVALCGILVLFIIVFKWPMKPREKPKYQELMVVYQEEIILQPMVITRQNIGVAAPPKPIVQALASEYRLIEEDFLTIERPNLLVDEFEQARNASTGWIGEEQKITGDPDRFARIKKIVEPSYSNEVLASNDQYKIGVEMIVDSSGKVVDAYVSSIEQILDNGESVEMDQVQFGILEAIIEAAFMWEFTPAVKEGKTVKTQRTEFFNFGHADC